MRRRQRPGRNDFGNIGVERRIGIDDVPAKIERQGFKPILAADPVDWQSMQRISRTAKQVEQRLCEPWRQYARQRYLRDQMANFRVWTPVRVRDVDVGHAGLASAYGERNAEVADDYVGPEALDKAQVFFHIAVKRLGVVDRPAGLDRAPKALGRNRPDRLAGKRQRSDRARVARVGRKSDFPIRGVKTPCQRNGSCNMREGDRLGEEQDTRPGHLRGLLRLPR